LSDANIAALILDAGGEIDEKVGNQYAKSYVTNTQRFPEISDTTYTTPKTIELIALWLVLSAAFEILGEENRGAEDTNNKPNKVYFREKALTELESIRNGDIILEVLSRGTNWEATEKYPDDESSLDSVFTNEAMDAHW
jgi:hypothetical protein